MQPNNSNRERNHLEWPEELPSATSPYGKWFHPGSNICLDFHGDPISAELVVFSDGNHHMALLDCLKTFSNQHNELAGIFYATTPPGPIVSMLKDGGLQLGNLTIKVVPHVFISPPDVLNSLVKEGYMSGHWAFVRNRGNVLLVRKGNPKHIRNVPDILQDDVRLFMSNPETEKASYSAYVQTLQALAPGRNDDPGLLDAKIAKRQVLFGKCIHHREAPQAVADGSADVAVVFYHLALRYTRIFPGLFDIVPLGGRAEAPEPLPGNVIGTTHMGLVKDGGHWGQQLIKYLESKEAMDIYLQHGLTAAG